MKLAVISFTSQGILLGEKIKQILIHEEVVCFTKCQGVLPVGQKEPPIYVEDALGEWTGQVFSAMDGLVFVGAAGIAVRAIAPYVKDKLQDPAVVVCDEKEQFVIPILSGHYGGANELAVRIATGLGAAAVLTTATDVNHKWAVDVFAAKNQLSIGNREGIAKVSAKLLAGDYITFYSAKEVRGSFPPQVTGISDLSDLSDSAAPSGQAVDVWVSTQVPRGKNVLLQLCPRAVWIGMGCKKGKTFEEVEAFFLQTVRNAYIHRTAIAGIASIGEKREEEAFVRLAEKYELEFRTFSAEQLNELPGTFSGSEFVKRQMGVDNVCERAAVLAAGAGAELVEKKQARDGMTIAIAEADWSVTMDEA
ncbi:MAG: cobalamin biosynthesis protein [Lachnospiraceae bacterium]|nr:cobalamin biosynthesis protein [Lachnospiraceae bacterium]